MRLLSVLLILVSFKSLAEDVKERSVLSSSAVTGFVLTGAALNPEVTLPMSLRCASIINCADRLKDKANCYSSIGNFISAAQLSPSYYLTDDLISSAKDQRTSICMNRLGLALTKNPKKFNLWDLMYRCFDNSKERTFKFLASFFAMERTTSLPQDVDRIRQDLMQRIIARVNQGSMDAYPKGVGLKKSSIYHFYSIGQMALNMRAKGVPSRFAAALPFTLNEGYENAFNFANKIKGEKPSYSDIYSSYAGISFALSDDVTEYKDVKYDEFKKKYSDEGSSAVGNYFQNRFGKESFCNGVVDYKVYQDERKSIKESLGQKKSSVKEQ